MAPFKAVNDITHDLRYGWRSLRRSPGFAAIAVLSLGFGIGANTAIFALIHTVLLARLPIRNPEQLVALRATYGDKGATEQFSDAERRALGPGPIELAAFNTSVGSVEANGTHDNASVDLVDGNYFGMLGVPMQRGRPLTATDDARGELATVISDRFWRGRLNADPGTVGRTLKIRDATFTIVGITAPAFTGVRFPAAFDLAIPLGTARLAGFADTDSPEPQAASPPASVIGRLRDGIPLRQAQAALRAAYQACCATGQLASGPAKGALPPARLDVVDVSRGIANPKVDVRGRFRLVLFALMGGVVVLLLVTCANVGTLLLARAESRQRELAVRLSLGASRARLVGQLLTESLQLAALGALMGVAVAWWGTRLLAQSLPASLASFASTVSIRPDLTVLAFTVVVAGAAGLAFGLLPALRLLRADLMSPLKQGGIPSRSSGRLSLDAGAVGTQVALALVLVMSATLFVETLQNLRRLPLGFDGTGMLVAQIDTRGTPYEQANLSVAMATEIQRAVGHVPGVRAAALSSTVPVFGGRTTYTTVEFDGNALPGSDQPLEINAVTPGYLAALGVPLRRGRDIATSDLGTPGTTERVAVVNDAFVKHFLPGHPPLGRTYRTGDRVTRIVGVVADARYEDLRMPATPMAYIPVTDDHWPFLVLTVRTTGNAADLSAPVAHAVQAAAPGISIRRVSTMGTAIDDQLARERFAAGLVSLFGAVALGLAAMGLYGVMAYRVGGRTVEIGVRIALGANVRSIMWLVLRQSCIVVGAGLAVGVPLSLLATRSIAAQLYGVSAFNRAALATSVGLLALIAFVASVLPVRRAITVDPLVALRAG